jgi:hypothetical protein
MIMSKLVLFAALLSVASALVTPPAAHHLTTTTAPSPLRTTVVLSMAGDDTNDQEFMRWARASRTASSDDNVVELSRPLGLVLNQDDKGNVFVETVAPKGNAARTGKVGIIALVALLSGCVDNVVVVPCRSFLHQYLYFQVKEGDIVTMCSATFGEDMWSTRYVDGFTPWRLSKL